MDRNVPDFVHKTCSRIDANGDVYSLYFTTEPLEPGYRVFKLSKGSLEREEVAWVKSVRETPSYTHMGPVPTANYIIIVEPPMPLILNYDWAKYHTGFKSDEPMNVSQSFPEGREKGRQIPHLRLSHLIHVRVLDLCGRQE